MRQSPPAARSRSSAMARPRSGSSTPRQTRSPRTSSKPNNCSVVGKYLSITQLKIKKALAARLRVLRNCPCGASRRDASPAISHLQMPRPSAGPNWRARRSPPGLRIPRLIGRATLVPSPIGLSIVQSVCLRSAPARRPACGLQAANSPPRGREKWFALPQNAIFLRKL